MENKKITANKQKKVRQRVQTFFVIFITAISVFKTLEEQGIKLPFAVSAFHSICPFGAVETLGRIITQGKFIPKTNASNFWVFSGVIILSLLFGRVFCSTICPLGSIQDLFYSLGKKIRKAGQKLVKNKSLKTEKTEKTEKKEKTITTLNKIASSFKYILLIMIIIQTTRLVTLSFVRIDPYYALFNFWNGSALPSAIIVLAIVLILSLFISRPWCRWLCPLGALLALFNIISPWKIYRDNTKCTTCKLCEKKCPMGIKILSYKKINHLDCIACGECYTSCPQENALKSRNKIFKTLPEKTWAPVLFALIFLIPTIMDTSLSSTNIKKPTLQNDTNAITAPVNIAELEIKSSMTLANLAKASGMTINELKDFLKINIDVSDNTKLRDIEDFQAEITLKYIKEKFKTYKPE